MLYPATDDQTAEPSGNHINARKRFASKVASEWQTRFYLCAIKST